MAAPDASDDDAAPDASPEDDEPEDDDAMEPSEPQDPEVDDGYAILGRAELGHAMTSTPGLTASITPFAEGCPFPPDSAPCTDEACLADPDSPECKDVIEEHCMEFGCDEPGPGPDGKPDDGTPGPGPDGKPDGEPDGGEWACDVDPTWPPCEVCLDPEATGDDCGNAWSEHCSEYPGDEWCDGDDDHEPLDVYTPTSLGLLVYQVEFSAAEDCSDPVLVGASEDARLVDLASAPELVDAEPPADGVYPCVIITMSDHIQWTVDGDGPCAGTEVQDVYGQDGVEEMVRLHLSTAGTQEGNAFEAPGITLEEALHVGPEILHSTFVVGMIDGLHLREDGDETRCEMQKPTFTFETTYE